MSGTNYLFLFGVCLIFHSVTSAPLSLLCPGVIPNGEHAGRFTGIISKEGWVNTNYLFQPADSSTPGCVEYNDSLDPMRSKLILAAYLTNAMVKIDVGRNHDVTGIAFGNNPPAAKWYVQDVALNQ